MTRTFHSIGQGAFYTEVFEEKNAMAIPIRYPPIIFALKVPSGIAGQSEFSLRPKNHLNNAPMLAPKDIANIE